MAVYWNFIYNKTASLVASATETGSTKLATLSAYWSNISNKTASFALTIKDSFTTTFENILTNIISMLNKVIETLNKIPGVNIDKIAVPQFAKGGIVEGPTLAMVGEAGREAVIPLENNTGWISVLAGELVKIMNGTVISTGGGSSIVIPVYIGTKKITEIVIDDINKKTSTTGVCPIKI